MLSWLGRGGPEAGDTGPRCEGVTGWRESCVQSMKTQENVGSLRDMAGEGSSRKQVSRALVSHVTPETVEDC